MGVFTNAAATGATSSVQDNQSTTKGFLIPRMTTTQINAISTPTEGLQAYDNTLHVNKVYDATAWRTNFSGGYGQTSFSGNGSSTSFTIAHGLTGISTTSKAFVTARNSATAGWSYIDVDATNITVNYAVAPASGTNNLKVDWQIIP